uniref:Nephrocystin 3-like N-terminal domain-containing protein n=1 Tax=Bionectria ochroleuca TaxID=29856 RepID=A0A8H7K4X3_BIOOC
MPGHILDTGISVVYEPEQCSPIVDIVIVHGLHGHPYKTWIYKKDPQDQQDVLEEDDDSSRRKKQKISDRVIPLFRGSKSDNIDIGSQSSETLVHGQGSRNGESSCVFWPRDILPSGCPKARVLVFGYDSKVTKYTSGATNQNSVHSHSKDLLFALMRERPTSRRLIFVAHSLGGIVVKEMLAISSAWPTPEYQDVVRSTSAVVFLGTPHRGSPDLASFGEWARSFISAFRIQTTSDILDALGMKNTDLERAQEAFSAVWQTYDFRIKTFQEGLGLRGINLGVLGNKVVPDSSSLIGDYRECAETLQANHKNMCRFFGHDDPNYRKVGGEICSIYRSITDFDSRSLGRSELMEIDAWDSMPPQSSVLKTSGHWPDEQLTENEKKILESLWFPGMDLRHQTNWFHNREQDVYQGLLVLKGKPGAGKSVLMKEAFRRSTKERLLLDTNCATAAFFFHSKGAWLQNIPTGLLRSLLYQLLPRFRRDFENLGQVWAHRGSGEDAGEQKDYEWSVGQLQGLFQSLFDSGKHCDITIFIDALDECHPLWMRRQASFWRWMTKYARNKGSRLNVCFSIRHHPHITLENCAEVIVEHHNEHDIATYVKRKLPCDFERQAGKWAEIRRTIILKSAGVFLWVILVVEKVLRMWDEGEHPRYILAQLEIVPDSLRALFSQLFEGSTAASNALAIKLFCWVILAAKPLRLREWHHILAFSKQPGLSSLKEWRESDNFTEDDEQLEKQIKAISKGLIEVTGRPTVSQGDNVDSSSMRAGAGSLDFHTGETRVVQAIHESVCEFSKNGSGFAILHENLTKRTRRCLDDVFEDDEKYIREGHLYIMNTALDYIGIRELDALVEARRRAAEHAACAEPNLGSTALQTHLDLPGDVEPRGPTEAQTPERAIFALPRHTINLGAKFDALRAAVPSLNMLYSTTWHEDDQMFVDHTTPREAGQPKLSKAKILDGALEQIQRLEENIAGLERGNKEMNTRLAAFETLANGIRGPSLADPGQATDKEEAAMKREKSLTWQGCNDRASLKISEHAELRIPLRTTQKRNLSEMIGSSQVVEGTIDVPQWISVSKEAIDHGSDDGTGHGSIETSVSVHTQTLDDHPALLLYVTSEFFTHARLAQSFGANPTEIIKRLYLEGGLNRLSILREDKNTIQPSTEGLDSWARAMEYMGLVQKEGQSPLAEEGQSPLAEGKLYNELSPATKIRQQSEEDDLGHTTWRKRQDNEPSRSSSPSSSTTARDSEDGDKRPETRVIQEEDIITGDVHPTRAVEDDVLPEISSLGRTLTWQSAFIIVMSRVIGSGIFATPGVILRSVGSPGLTLVLWLVGAVIAACGLSVSLEYGCMLPRSGGEKVYLEFTYRHPRFLASTLVAIQAVLLGLASNCVVFSQYVLFALGIDHPSEVLRKGLAAGLLVFVTVTHGVFPKTGIRLQNILGWVKIAIVGFMILSGIYVLVFRPGTATTGSSPPVSDQLSWDHVWEGSVWNWGTIATSFFKVLYSFAGLDNVSNVLNEVKEPVRTLKSVTTAALFTTCGLYILINLAYLLVVPVDEIKQSGELIAALFFERIFGHGFGKTALPLAVALSAVGNVLVVAFAQARLKQEIARQGFLPYSHLLSSTKPFGSPLGGFVVHFIPSLLVIVLPPSAEVYSFILELEGYPGQIFSFAICSGLLLLRFKRPDLRRPFKAWTPAVLIKIALSVALLAAPFFPPSQKPANGMFYATYAIVGVSILVAGVIYWYLWTVLIPRWRGYTLEEETGLLDDGTSITRLVHKPQ